MPNGEDGRGLQTTSQPPEETIRTTIWLANRCLTVIEMSCGVLDELRLSGGPTHAVLLASDDYPIEPSMTELQYSPNAAKVLAHLGPGQLKLHDQLKLHFLN